MVKSIKESEFEVEVLQASTNQKVLVDFWAPWCGPCVAMAPALEDAYTENPNIKIIKINVDENPQISGQYGIRSIPTLLMFENKKVIKTEVGLKNKSQILEMFN